MQMGHNFTFNEAACLFAELLVVFSEYGAHEIS
jgi:hypothetical protein